MSETRWPAERARDWQAERGWRVGCNFNPSTASNQLQRLRNKFDFADSAGSQLDIVGHLALLDLGRDHAMHFAQRLEHAEIQVAPEHKRRNQFMLQLIGNCASWRWANNARLDVGLYQNGRSGCSFSPP